MISQSFFSTKLKDLYILLLLFNTTVFFWLTSFDSFLALRFGSFCFSLPSTLSAQALNKYTIYVTLSCLYCNWRLRYEFIRLKDKIALLKLNKGLTIFR